MILETIMKNEIITDVINTILCEINWNEYTIKNASTMSEMREALIIKNREANKIIDILISMKELSNED